MQYSISQYLKTAVFQTIYGMVKYIPTPIGDVFRIVVLKIFMKKLQVGWVRTGVHIWWPENISIGKSFLNEDIFLNGLAGITICDHVMMGHRCTITTDDHYFENPDILPLYQGRKSAPIIIEDGAYIGINVVILPGVTIGAGAVIGAGSIVNKSIPSMAVAVGVPARVIRYRGDKLKGNI